MERTIFDVDHSGGKSYRRRLFQFNPKIPSLNV
jgi:hypothetical protein